MKKIIALFSGIVVFFAVHNVSAATYGYTGTSGPEACKVWGIDATCTTYGEPNVSISSASGYSNLPIHPQSGYSFCAAMGHTTDYESKTYYHEVPSLSHGAGEWLPFYYAIDARGGWKRFELHQHPTQIVGVTVLYEVTCMEIKN